MALPERSRWIMVLAVTSVLAAALGYAAIAWTKNRATSVEADLTVSPEEAFTAELPGQVRLAGPVGSVDQQGRIKLELSTVQPPPTFLTGTQWADSYDVSISGATIEQPLTLTVLSPNPPSPQAVPVFAHRDHSGNWSVREAQPGPEGTVVLQSSEFSVNVLGWLSDKTSAAARAAAAKVTGVFDSVADSLTGRTDPPPCGPEPSWAVLDKRTTLVHACVEDAGEGDEDLAEVQLSSNRRFFTLASVPPRSHYVWTSQSDSWLSKHVSRWLPTATKPDERLLPPAGMLTAGFTPSDTERQDTFVISLDHWTAALSLAYSVTTTLGAEGKGGMLASVLGALSCAEDVPSDFSDTSKWWGFTVCLITQPLQELSDPAKAVAAAEDLIGDVPHPEVQVAASQLNQAASRIRAAGTAIKAVGLGFLVRDIFQQIPDAFSQMGDDRTGDVVLTRGPIPPPPVLTGEAPIFFTFRDQDGWNWELSIDSLPTVVPEVDVSESPPGRAKVTYSLEGSIEGSLESLDAGRTPPQRGFYIDYLFQDMEGVPEAMGGSSWFNCSGSKWTDGNGWHYPVLCSSVASIFSDEGVQNGDPSHWTGLSVGQSGETTEANARLALEAFAPTNLKSIVLRNGGVNCQFTIDPQSGSARVVTGSPNTFGSVEGCEVLD